MKNFLGFTLSELLVSLAVIGVIAAVSVPKIIGNISEQQRRMVFKESLNVINLAFNQLVEDGFNATIPITRNLGPLIKDSRVCDTDPVAQGCASAVPASGIMSFSPTQALRLTNGSVVYFRQSTTTPNMMWFYLDVDGGGALRGDTLVLEYNLREVPAERHPGWSGIINPGEIKPTRGYTADMAFYRSLYQ